jgi:hypothetical protein
LRAKYSCQSQPLRTFAGGAPRGNRNALKHGLFTTEDIEANCIVRPVRWIRGGRLVGGAFVSRLGKREASAVARTRSVETAFSSWAALGEKRGHIERVVAGEDGSAFLGYAASLAAVVRHG